MTPEGWVKMADRLMSVAEEMGDPTCGIGVQATLCLGMANLCARIDEIIKRLPKPEGEE